ncbi:STM3941 family protein [Dinghuibacter silviterrae]|uniref:PH (Pleckstrin Homology) domain-containing protein n=1 Tax=Dinghuibacter silviterrae TaxID=1539049 RepID=A0A4R8DMP8_9BACT|nr:STM3941 family protein [Dinghuibacter silviterrae]TDW99269.1 hypothetical protein EDB95_0278 [Dinghuibacter silviterrae]
METPLNIYINKKNTVKKIFLYTLGFLFFVACFLLGIYFFPDDWKVVIMPVCAITMAVSVVAYIREYNRKTPVVAVDHGGIEVFEKMFDGFGRVLWADITGFRELALNGKDRRLILFVRNPERYIGNLDGAKKRNRFLKASGQNSNGLLWIDMSRIAYDHGAFKKMLGDHIKK